MEQDKEAFLARWSRLKQQKPVEEKGESAPPALPPVEELTPESDFSGFMHPKVRDVLRRVALKKLFSDPRFNVPDPFEAYSGDWTGGEPIPPDLLAKLNQARTVLFPEKDEPKKDQEGEQEKPAPQEAGSDEPGRQDA